MDSLPSNKIPNVKAIIIIIGFGVIILIGFMFLKTTPLDEYGHYYKNAFGVYTNISGFPEVKKINIPAKLEDTDPYDFSLIHVEWSPDNKDIPIYAYAKSDQKVYFNNKIIEGVDIETFEHVGGGYSKDQKNIFFKETKVEGMDYESFRHVSESIAVDEKGFYYRSFPILKETDYQTYVLFNPQEAEVVIDDEGVLFIQDLSGKHKIGEQIKAKKMGDIYHQAKNSDSGALKTYDTQNMTVYSTHVLY